jgi:hypothetical protein
MKGLKKDTRKIKYFLMKTLRTIHATTCRTFSIVAYGPNKLVRLYLGKSFKCSVIL